MIVRPLKSFVHTSVMRIDRIFNVSDIRLQNDYSFKN